MAAIAFACESVAPQGDEAKVGHFPKAAIAAQFPRNVVMVSEGTVDAVF